MYKIGAVKKHTGMKVFNFFYQVDHNVAEYVRSQIQSLIP